MKTKLSKFFCLILVGVTNFAAAQFAPNDDVELLTDEPLLFNTTVHRQGKKGERFSVAAYRPETRKVFLISKDEKGKTIALNVPEAAVVRVKKDPAVVNEQAFAAMREGRLVEAQKLMFQVAALDPERSVCGEIATQLGRINTAQLAYDQELKKLPQIEAEVQRRLRNAAITDRPNPLNANDNSNQVRAEQMRQDAELWGTNAKALIKTKQEMVASELQRFGVLAESRVTNGAYGEALNIRDTIKTLISRLPNQDGMPNIEFNDNMLKPRRPPVGGGVPGLDPRRPVGGGIPGLDPVPAANATTFESNLEISELEKRAALSTMNLDLARRSLAAKKLNSALLSASAGLAAEHGSYSLRRLHDDISARIEVFNRAFAAASGHEQLKQYEKALKTLELAREDCTDHEASEALIATLKKTIAEKDQRIAKAKTAEAAQSYANALEIYETYAMEEDVKRVLPLHAKQKETEGDFLTAHSIYEKVGAHADMQRVLVMKDEQITEYGKARVFLVDGKFAEALAIYRRYKNNPLEKDALRQQGIFLEAQGKFDEAIEVYREAQFSDEIARVKKFVSERESNLKEGHQQEQAASFDKAIELFQKANSPNDVRRAASTAAKMWEDKADLVLAAEYYEIAGMYEEAGRIRKSPAFTNFAQHRRLSGEEIVKRCGPACVTIVSENVNGSGLGSGFFVAKGGYVLTNNHVIKGATGIRVITASRETLNAKLVKSSAVPDLALLKVELSSHPIIPIGDSDKVVAGSYVAAIGSPKGLSQSFTHGSVSNADRVYSGNKCFQISVLINHGNSGGPLINEFGQAIGINTFGEGTAVIIDGKGIGSDIQGINYAIKINEAKQLLDGNAMPEKSGTAPRSSPSGAATNTERVEQAKATETTVKEKVKLTTESELKDWLSGDGSKWYWKKLPDEIGAGTVLFLADGTMTHTNRSRWIVVDMRTLKLPHQGIVATLIFNEDYTKFTVEGWSGGKRWGEIVK